MPQASTSEVNSSNVLAVILGGGVVGTLSVSRTLFGYQTGARSRMGGLLAGLLCLAPLALAASATVRAVRSSGATRNSSPAERPPAPQA